MAQVVIFNPAEVAKLLRSQDGLVGKDIQRRTLKVHAAAVRNCPVRTGRLRSSIRWSMGSDQKGVFGLVSSDVTYAGFVNDGTRFMEGRHFLDDALKEANG